jgi:hypothetical protein
MPNKLENQMKAANQELRDGLSVSGLAWKFEN